MSQTLTAQGVSRAEECNIQLRERFGPERTLAGFYISNPVVSQDEWMNPPARELRRRGYATAGILAAQAIGAARLDETDVTLELERKDVPRLSRIQLFIVSDMETAATA